MKRTLGRMTRLRSSLIALVTVAIVGLGLAGASQVSASGPPAGLGGHDWEVLPTTHKVVALTFDAGANADAVSRILTTLQREHVPATFFLTGDFVHDFPSQAKAIVAAGERVGDHSVSHPYFTTLTDAQIRYQVLQARDSIRAVTGANPWPWFRFPNGDVNARTISVVNSVGFVPIRWTADTLGYKGTREGMSTQTVLQRVLAALRPGEIVLMHCGSNPYDHSTLDADALPAIIEQLRARGYRFVTIDAFRGIGYLALTSGGGIHGFGAPEYGSDERKLPAGVHGVGVAINPVSGGYWILKSDGGVDSFNASWYGGLRGKLTSGQTVTGIAATPHQGYLILTSNGAVHGFNARVFGSDEHRLPTGVRAVALAADPATGGYWILKSDGGVDSFNAPWYGGLRGKIPTGQKVTGIASAPHPGYLIGLSGGGVHAYGTPFYGSDGNRLPQGVRAVALAGDPVTGGYWILKSDGGVDSFNAPWYGGLRGKIPTGQTVTALAGE